MSLYDDIVTVTKDYMGPTAKRFVDRQLSGHLKMEPYQLNRHHLEELAKWCYTSGRLVMREERAQEFSNRIQRLRE